MKKHLFKALRVLLLIIIVIIIYFAGILIINTVFDYRPEGGVFDVTEFKDLTGIENKGPFSMVTWNIGYAGLGRNSDFFYDGGKMTRPGKIDYYQYWKGLVEQIQHFDTLDFMLLQEVDIASSRSYRLNQQAVISESLGSHAGVFAKNYDVKFVPVPLFRPMAKVVSGISFFTKYKVIESGWRSFDEDRSWPVSLFKPDRCYMSTVVDLPSNKKLYIINTHNSAFDDGSLRNNQLKRLYEIMLAAYQNGHYVIAGGDWNINPKDYSNGPFISGDLPFSISDVQKVCGPDTTWIVAFDPDYPSNRDVSTPYVSGETPATIIDFFVCSPNIEIFDVKTLYDGFTNTDHEPVYLRFGLK